MGKTSNNYKDVDGILQTIKQKFVLPFEFAMDDGDIDGMQAAMDYIAYSYAVLSIHFAAYEQVVKEKFNITKEQMEDIFKQWQPIIDNQTRVISQKLEETNGFVGVDDGLTETERDYLRETLKENREDEKEEILKSGTPQNKNQA